MATITQEHIVKEIMDNNGYYEGDPQVVKIVQYENIFDGKRAWGLIYKGEDPMRYHTGATINPTTIWEAK